MSSRGGHASTDGVARILLDHLRHIRGDVLSLGETSTERHRIQQRCHVGTRRGCLIDGVKAAGLVTLSDSLTRQLGGVRLLLASLAAQQLGELSAKLLRSLKLSL